MPFFRSFGHFALTTGLKSFSRLLWTKLQNETPAVWPASQGRLHRDRSGAFLNIVALGLEGVVAVLVVLISIVPVYLAHRLTREEGGATAGRGARGGRIEGGGVETEATAVP